MGSGLAGPHGGQVGAQGRQQAHPDPLRRSPTASPGVFSSVQLLAWTAGASPAFCLCRTNDSINRSELQREFLVAADTQMHCL